MLNLNFYIYIYINNVQGYAPGGGSQLDTTNGSYAKAISPDGKQSTVGYIQ